MTRRVDLFTALRPLIAVGPSSAPEDLTWQDAALCAETDPEVFFPDKGGSTGDAKRVCRACEVRAECLEYALRHDFRYGVWGGASERERRRLKGAAPRRGRPASRFRGVDWNKNAGKWKARATIAGERVYLGLFASEEQARDAVLEAERAASASPAPQPRKAAALCVTSSWESSPSARRSWWDPPPTP